MERGSLKTIRSLSKRVMLFIMMTLCTWISMPQTSNAGGPDHSGRSDEVTPLSPKYFKKMLQQFWTKDYGSIQMPDSKSFSKLGMLKPGYEWEVVAKAQPDECFQGVGNPANQVSFYRTYPGNLTPEEQQNCYGFPIDGETPAGHAQPKVNQAYVWGLTQHGNDLWFGTIPNTHCLVISGYLGIAESSLNDSWVCEGGLSDFRPPRAYYYNIKSKVLTEVTQDILDNGDTDYSLIRSTIGLRSAGSHNGVVFLGGIGQTGVNLFAFNAQTHEYIGSMKYEGYTNIRQWRVIKGDLYVGVGTGASGGEILRWTGCPADPFQFETVGKVSGDPAYLTYHEGRIFVSTWPGPAPMSIVMSPPLGKDRRLTSEDATGWKSVWSYSQYDPEPAVVYSAGGGALMSYQGCLYWGTMHVPGLSLVVWNQLNGDSASSEDADAALLGTYRPISIFRGKNLGTSKQKVELLYGNAKLPMYVADGPDAGWQTVPNKMGQKPKFGLAGFNNFFNNYTWWMEVFDNRLFVGTMDFLYLIDAEIGNDLNMPPILDKAFEKFYGADLWTFSSPFLPASPVSISGVGNYSNYGIRTMVSTKKALYLGSANPMNLMTDPTDDLPEGGWELIKLTR